MILIDANQITIGNIMGASKGNPSLNENLIRHSIMSTLLAIRNHHYRKYGELVLCYDSPYTWRKRAFPHYKTKRKKDRAKSPVDWATLFSILIKIQGELRENMPYKVMTIDNCEADDIIAVLTQKYHTHEPMLIVSSDGDFQQLQKYPNVAQYSPLHRKMMVCESPSEYLFEHIIRGDQGDGIPNILSEDDIFTKEGVRQSSITTKKYNDWLAAWKNAGAGLGNDIPFTDDPETLANINRNRMLIDFDKIPEDIKNSVLQNFESIQPASRSRIMTYFMDQGMRNLMSSIPEF